MSHSTLARDPGRRWFVGTMLLVGGCALRLDGKEPEEDFDYRAAPAPVPVAPAGGQEVVEFFWYGCPHCRAFEPSLNEWRRTLSPEVLFRKVHVALNPKWEMHQRLFVTLAALGKESDEMNARVFDAIQVAENPLDTRESIVTFLVGNGIDRGQVLETVDSPAIASEMARATQFGAAMGVQGVPGLGVNGRWLTSPGMAGDRAAALRVVDYLLRRDRSRA